MGTSFPFTNAFQPFIESSVRNNVVVVVQFSVALSSPELVTVQDDGSGEQFHRAVAAKGDQRKAAGFDSENNRNGEFNGHPQDREPLQADDGMCSVRYFHQTA